MQTKTAQRHNDTEVGVHIWKQAETESTVATYTISVGKRAICHYMPIDQALDSLRAYMEEL